MAKIDHVQVFPDGSRGPETLTLECHQCGWTHDMAEGAEVVGKIVAWAEDHECKS